MDINFSYEIELNKIYIDDTKRKLFGIEDNFISIQYQPISETQIMAKLRINKDKTISTPYFENKIQAKLECMKKAFFYFDKLARKIENEKKYLKRKQKLIKKMFIFLIFIGYLSLAILYFGYNFNQNSVLLLLSIFSILISPIYFINYDIGKCIAERVLVRRLLITQNVYHKTIKCLYQDDLVLFKNAEEETPKENCFEAEITKQVVLRSNNPEELKLKSFTLPEKLGVLIRKDKGKYFITVVSYQKDGKMKMYYNHNVPKKSFALVNCPKYKVISRHGSHYVKQKFIVNNNLKNLDWYFGVLKIYKSYIEAFLLSFTKYYEKDNKTNGFDNFKNNKSKVEKQTRRIKKQKNKKNRK